ncbi:MAG: nuclear transport factor 2 family protein [Pseudomonadota bacterium]
MQRTEDLLHRFYGAFAQLDAKTMADCYAENAIFRDEAFSLQGKAEIAAMWQMLCEGAKASSGNAWRLESSAITADDRRGQAHWEAHYRFSATGRQVHNIIDAQFEFDGSGLIALHHDRFDFWRWSRQALGLPGTLLGWSSWLRRKVRAAARKNLDRYLRQRTTKETP